MRALWDNNSRRIGSTTGKGRKRYSDQEIGEMRWLHEHGWPPKRIVEAYDVKAGTLANVLQGTVRPQVDAREPAAGSRRVSEDVPAHAGGQLLPIVPIRSDETLGN